MRQILVIISLLLVPATGVGAVTLTLEECVDLATSNNRGMKSVEMEVAASREDIAISRSGFLPALKMKAAYSLIDRPGRLIIDRNSFGGNIPPQNVEISTNNRDFYYANVTLDQPLFTGWRLTHTLKKSEAANAEAALHSERERETLVFRVRKGFYDVLTTQLQRQVTEKIVGAKQERLRILEELQHEGYVGKEEVLQQEADVAFAEAEAFKSRQKEELARSSLKQHLYLKESVDLSLAGTPQGLSLSVPLQDVTKFAIENRKDLKMAKTRIKGADEDISIARSGYYPQLSLQGNYIREKETNITRPDVWMVSANLDWSIFEWGKTTAEVRRKTAERQRLIYAYEEQERSVALEAERSWRELKEKELYVKAYEKRVKTLEYIAGVTAEKYAEGSVKLVDVIEAETELLKEFNQYLISVNDLNNAAASLDLAASGAPAVWFASLFLYSPDIKIIPHKTKKPLPSERTPESSSLPRESQSVLTGRTNLPSHDGTDIDIESAGVEKDIEELARKDFLY